MSAITEIVDFDEVKVDPAWALRLSSTIAMRRLAIPLCMVDGEIVTAMSDPTDTQTIDAVARATGHPVRPMRADAQRLRKILLTVYGDARSSTPRSGALSDDPVVIVDDLLRAATLRMASDVHMDPERSGFRIRMRVDGQLEDFMRLPSDMQAAVCSRVKVMAGLDIAERRAPQDGAFVWSLPGNAGARPFDIRVATLPVRFGERVTLRMLESGAARHSLDSLGLSQIHLERFRKVLSRPHGLVLLTGPTGSGKTTTLYAAIRHLLDGSPLNIVTVEDPVEYEIDGIAQAEVDSGDKVNFSKALRSILRHDPDVVMIGEIRDTESLDTAVKAALTGHLVLSTLHTNNAVSAVTRLLDMGLAPHLAAATLRLSAAQRLVRKLCPKCREQYVITAAEAAALGVPSLSGKTGFKPHGCLACAGRGYTGRTGLFEFMMPDASMASMIASGASEGELSVVMRDQREPTLLDAAITKIISGETSVMEALKTVSAD